MTFTYQGILTWLSQLIWPLLRISGLFISMPLISSAVVPNRVRVIFAFALSFLILPMVPERLSFLNFNGTFVVHIFNELMLGIMMGFILQLVFQIFVMGGQIISLQAGLGFAIMVDPDSHASVPLLSQFYQLMTALTFLALDGHLAVLDALMVSFREMPVGSLDTDLSGISSILAFSSLIFKESVLVSLPAILALLIVNLSFGIMTRMAPQLNIFSLGFPISLLMGVIIVKISLPGVSAQIADSLEQGMQLIKGLLH